jgi:hypothetical protein
MAPAPNPGGEGAQQRLLRRLLGAGDEVMQLRALSCPGCATGRDEGFEPSQASWAIFARCGVPHRVVANVKAEQVDPWLAVVGHDGMGDPRLAGLQREARRAEPLGDEGVAAF